MPQPSIFHRLGVKPVINACGIYTDLGGSILSPQVWAAMTEVNASFVSLPDLLDRTGDLIARLVGAQAARVTPGAAAAIALGVGACMTGGDGEKMERLPDTSGMSGEVVLQRNQRLRWKYTRCTAMPGARIVDAGDPRGTTREQLDAALSAHPAAVLVPAHLDAVDGTLPLAEIIAAARRQGVPVVVDAAFLNFPPERMRSFTAAGADLVCFSAKYFWGPNAGGFICGRADLIAAVAAIDFTRFESGRYRVFGRPFKMDRHTIVATALALADWLAMDHQARLDTYVRQVRRLAELLGEIPGLVSSAKYFTMDEAFEDEPVNCLHLRFTPLARRSAADVATVLAAGDPSIQVIVEGDQLAVVMETVREGDERLIAERLRDALL